jgi:Tfp pilus assembly protein FimT
MRNHRRAFTMIELVMIVVVIAILAAVAVPKLATNDLQDATNQIIRHIRYTQHLAMTDDKYISNPTVSRFPGTQAERHTQFWFEGRWQMLFHASEKHATYSIFSDLPTGSDTTTYDSKVHSPNTLASLKNIATDPLTKTKLTGHHWGATIFQQNEPYRTEELQLNEFFGISRIDISELQQKCNKKNKANKGANAQILFDTIGRPYCRQKHDPTLHNPYEYLLKSTAKIKLCLDDPCSSTDTSRYTQICIEPYTGYVHDCTPSS